MRIIKYRRKQKHRSIQAPARKACLKPARNSLGKLPDAPAGTSPGGGRRPPPGEVLDSVSWILPERVLSQFETRFSGSGACIDRCFCLCLYFDLC